MLMLPSLILNSSVRLVDFIDQRTNHLPVRRTPAMTTAMMPSAQVAELFLTTTMSTDAGGGGRRSTIVPPDHPYVVFAREIYVWLVPTLVTILIVSAIGNALIVLSTPLMGRSLNPYNRLCVSLAATDAWAASLLISGLVVNSYMPIVLKIQKRNECIPAMLEIFRISGMLTSILHLLALAVNQYVGILYPLHYKALITTSRIRRLILALWLVPIIFVSSWFVSIPNDGFRSPTCSHRFYGRFPFRLSIFISFTIPLFITFAVYAVILFRLLHARATCDSENLRDKRLRSYQRRVRSKLKLVFTTLLILSTFTLSWGTCVLYFMMVCVEGCMFTYLQDVSFHTGFLINSSVNILVILKLLLNPLIYALRMRNIRWGLYRLLGVTLCCHFSALLPCDYNTSLPTKYQLSRSQTSQHVTHPTSMVSSEDMDTSRSPIRSISMVASALSTSINNKNNNNCHATPNDVIEFKNLRPHSFRVDPLGTNRKRLSGSCSVRERKVGRTNECLRIKLARLSAPIELLKLMEYHYHGDGAGAPASSNEVEHAVESNGRKGRKSLQRGDYISPSATDVSSAEEDSL